MPSRMIPITFSRRATASSRMSTTGTPYERMSRTNGAGCSAVSSGVFSESTSASKPGATRRKSAARTDARSINARSSGSRAGSTGHHHRDRHHRRVRAAAEVAIARAEVSEHSIAHGSAATAGGEAIGPPALGHEMTNVLTDRQELGGVHSANDPPGDRAHDLADAGNAELGGLLCHQSDLCVLNRFDEIVGEPGLGQVENDLGPVSYTHLRAH